MAENLVVNGVTYPEVESVSMTNVSGEQVVFSLGGGGSSFPNGTEWTQSNITGGNFNFVRNLDGMWVAGGSNGVYYSDDGKVWLQSNITGVLATAICTANGTWAVSTSDGVYYSDDGKVWTMSNIKDVSSGGFSKIYEANGVWVATSNSSEGLFYSTDGKVWAKSNVTSGTYVTLANGYGVWLACSFGMLSVSEDGKKWEHVYISGLFLTLHNANGIWVASDGLNATGLKYSEDGGRTWKNSNIAAGSFASVSYGDGMWVAGSGTMYSENGTGLYYSTDGKTWTRSNITSSMTYELLNANGIWVGCDAYKGLYYSIDGKTWVQSNVDGCKIRAVYNADGIWVVGGYSENGLYYSVTWEAS